MTWNDWCVQTLVLEPELAKHVRFTECEAVSGLTCRIHLIPGSEFPERIYVQPQDIEGNNLREEYLLIYPNLPKYGWKSGLATFLQVGHEPILYLRGEWQ